MMSKMSRYYLCTDCGEVYDSSSFGENTLYLICPKSNCYGTLIEIDELLIPTIKLLNNKGYTTRYCCSVHYASQHPNSYIMFEDWVDIPSVPKGFKKEDDGTYITIRSNLPSREPTYDDFKSICDNAKTLLDWAISLPELDY